MTFLTLKCWQFLRLLLPPLSPSLSSLPHSVAPAIGHLPYRQALSNNPFIIRYPSPRYPISRGSITSIPITITLHPHRHARHGAHLPLSPSPPPHNSFLITSGQLISLVPFHVNSLSLHIVPPPNARLFSILICDRPPRPSIPALRPPATRQPSRPRITGSTRTSLPAATTPHYRSPARLIAVRTRRVLRSVSMTGRVLACL